MQLRSGTSSDHNTSRPRILIADDHVIFVEALRAYLEKTYAVVGAVADGRAMLQEAFRLKPDVVVADISMPVLNGLDAARRIRKQAPKVTFVFLTMLDDANLAAAALELGRVAFVLKSCGGAEVLKAVQETLHGRSYMTPRLRAEDWVAAKARARQFSTELTERQRDVVQLFAQGNSSKVIAASLNLSEKTVEFHKYHIMQAFNLRSNADLVLFALKRGLISVNPESYPSA
jgi:DNA-binding NarL/FixJ family response regulator